MCLPSVAQSARALEERPRLNDVQVVNVAVGEGGEGGKPTRRNAYLVFCLPKPPSVKVNTVS